MYENIPICEVEWNNFIENLKKTTPLHDLLLYDFNLCYNLMKKLLLEHTIANKKFVKQFQILQKNNSKVQILKFLKDQKILKNQIIYCLKIIEINKIYMTKQ